LQDRVAKFKEAKQLANHAAKQARHNLQRQLIVQHNKVEETVSVNSDSEEKTVKNYGYMGTKMFRARTFLAVDG
jgi:hypothetical protein